MEAARRDLQEARARAEKLVDVADQLARRALREGRPDVFDTASEALRLAATACFALQDAMRSPAPDRSAVDASRHLEQARAALKQACDALGVAWPLD